MHDLMLIAVKVNQALNLGSQWSLTYIYFGHGPNKIIFLEPFLGAWCAVSKLFWCWLRAWFARLSVGVMYFFGQFWFRGDEVVYTQGCFPGHSGFIILGGGLTLAEAKQSSKFRLSFGPWPEWCKSMTIWRMNWKLCLSGGLMGSSVRFLQILA